jgi:hypothetical protein
MTNSAASPDGRMIVLGTRRSRELRIQTVYLRLLEHASGHTDIAVLAPVADARGEIRHQREGSDRGEAQTDDRRAAPLPPSAEYVAATSSRKHPKYAKYTPPVDAVSMQTATAPSARDLDHESAQTQSVTITRSGIG